MFPIHISLERRVFPEKPQYFEKTFMALMADKLSETEHVRCRLEGKQLSFNGAIGRFAWNGFHFLNGITSGKLSLQRTRDGQYRIKTLLYFWEMLVIASVFTIIPASVGPGLKPILVETPEQFRYMLLFIIWGLFYLGNYLISAARFNKQLKEVLSATYMAEYEEVIREKEQKLEQLKSQTQKQESEILQRS